jgi:alpha-tubulin suppressor-like RCC1 family protein
VGRAQIGAGDVLVSQVHAFWTGTCVVADGTGLVYCFGDNLWGQLGVGVGDPFRLAAAATPIVFSEPTVTVTRISGKFRHLCAVFTNQKARCWGSNDLGQLGLGSTVPAVGGSSSDMTSLPYLSFSDPAARIAAIDGGVTHTCVIFAVPVGRVACFGNGQHGRLGSGGTATVGLAATDMTSIEYITFSSTDEAIAVSLGVYHTCALFATTSGGSEGKIRCWGLAENGITGLSSRDPIGDDPTEMPALEYLAFSDTILAVQVSAGGAHNCATFANDRFRCWGQGGNGQLGRDSLDNSDPGVAPLAYINTLSSVLFRCSPAAAPVAGGTVITVLGLNFITPHPTIRFAKSSTGSCPTVPVVATGTTSSFTSIVVTTPAWGACGPSTAAVSVSQDAGATFTLTVPVVYYSPFSLTAFASASPTGGPISGQTAVSLEGLNLVTTPSTLCRWGSTLTSALTVTSATTGSCSSPVFGASLDAALDVALNGVDFTSSGLTFFAYDVTALALDVVRGPAAGATPVYVRLTSTGTVNHPGYSALVKLTSVGANTAGSTVVLTAAGTVVADAVAPSGFAVRFDSPSANAKSLIFPMSFTLVVSLNAGAQYLAPTTTFEYYADPSVISVIPAGIPAGVPATVTVLGSNFIDRTATTYCSLQQGAVVVQGTFQPTTSYILVSVPAMTAQVATVEVSLNDKRQYTQNGVTLSVFDVSSVTPPGGPLQGNTVVTINGAGFAGVTISCRFGSLPATAASRLSATQIVCPSPAATTAGSAVIAASLDGTAYSISTAVSFAYYAAPTITALAPTSGPTLPTTATAALPSITLYGASFAVMPVLSAKCRVGSTTTTASSATATSVVCPLSAAAGENAVSLALNGVDFATSALTYVAFSTLAVNPAVGPATGGTEVVVSGIGFSTTSGTWTCRFFGSVVVPATVQSAGQLKCVSPASQSPTTYVDASRDGILYTATTSALFTYYAVPTVVSVSPSAGKSTGGTVVTVTGTGFVAQQTALPIQCKFGTVVVTATTTTAAGSSPTRVLCTSPPGINPVAVTVSLNMADFSSATLAPVFSYFVVDAISPALGPAKGGTVVTLSGLGFTNQAACKFGDAAGAVVAVLDATRLLCRAPPAATATARSTVTISVSMNNGLEFVKAAAPYVYHMSPTVSSVTPTSGPSSGNTTVALYGSFPLEANHDLRLVQCVFEATSATALTANATVVTCMTPAGSGLVALRVTLNGQITDGTTAGTFSFFKLISIAPARGPTTGGTIVAVTGDGFVATSPLWCVVDGGGGGGGGAAFVTILLAARQSDQTVTCTLPSAPPVAVAPGSSALTVSISSDLGVTATGASAFTTYPPAVVEDFEPKTLPSGGGLVTITGSDFIPDLTTCRFGNSSSGDGTVMSINATAILCLAPPTGVANVTVSVSMNGQQYHATTSGALMAFTSCSPGTYSERDTDPCQPCPAGTYTDQVGARKCLACSTTEYAPLAGSANCTKCPDNTRAFVSGGAFLRESCVCAENYFHRRGAAGEPCEPCPAGGVCPGGTERAMAMAGFWTSSNDPFSFLPCSPASSCPGGSSSSCAVGYTGRLCSQCQKGWYRSTGACSKCPRVAVALILVFVLVAAVLVGLLLYGAGRKRKKAYGYAGTIGVATQFFQVLAIVAKLDFSWPESFQKAARAVTALFTLKIDIVAPECSAPSVNYIGKWGFMMLLPALMALPFIGFFLVGAAKPTRYGNLKAKAVNAFLTLLMLGYMSFAETALEPFGCKREVDETSSLVSDPSLACYDKWWHAMFPFALALSILYVVVAPLTVFGFLKRNQDKVITADPRFESFYGSLFLNFRAPVPFWAAAVMVENILIAAAGLFLNSAVPLQIVSLLAIFMASISVYSSVRPFVRPSDNVLQVRLRVCLVAVLLAGNIFYLGRGAPATKLTVATEVAAITLIALSIALILWSVAMGLRADHSSITHVVPRGVAELLCPRGLVLVNLWLCTPEAEGWSARLFALVGKVPFEDGDLLPVPVRVADDILALFTCGVFRRELLPQLRARLLDPDNTALRDEAVWCFKRLGASLRAQGLLSESEDIEIFTRGRERRSGAAAAVTALREMDDEDRDTASQLLATLFPPHLIREINLEDHYHLRDVHAFFLSMLDAEMAIPQPPPPATPRPTPTSRPETPEKRLDRAVSVAASAAAVQVTMVTELASTDDEGVRAGAVLQLPGGVGE